MTAPTPKKYLILRVRFDRTGSFVDEVEVAEDAQAVSESREHHLREVVIANLAAGSVYVTAAVTNRTGAYLEGERVGRMPSDVHERITSFDNDGEQTDTLKELPRYRLRSEL